MVLQGKSRSVIIRELQRTNLDVNLAVNNLLSRDDEDGDDGDDTASESYLPGGEASQHPAFIFMLPFVGEIKYEKESTAGRCEA